MARGFGEVGEMSLLCGLRGPEWRGHTSFGKKNKPPKTPTKLATKVNPEWFPP